MDILKNLKKITQSQRDALNDLLSKKIDRYVSSITFLTKSQQKKFQERCIEKKIHGSYEIDVDYKYQSGNKDPYIIYLTKRQSKDNKIALKNKKKYTIKLTGYHFKKICREVLNDNAIFNHLLKDVAKNEMNDGYEDYIPTYFPPKSDYWTMPLSKDVELYEKPTKRTITIGFKKRPKDFIKKFVKKDKIENYYPAVVYLNELNLLKYLIKIKKILKEEEKFGQSRLIKNKTEFYFPMSKSNIHDSKGFIFYLTKSQIKDLIREKTYGNRNFTKIYFSNN